MSKPVFEDLFAFRRIRRNRMSYFNLTLTYILIYPCLLIMVLFTTIVFLISNGTTSSGEILTDGVAILGLIVVIMGIEEIPSFGSESEYMILDIAQISMSLGVLILIALHIIAMTQRCRDINWSGWWVLLSLIPIVSLVLYVLLFIKRGTKGENRYDIDPLRKYDKLV